MKRTEVNKRRIKILAYIALKEPLSKYRLSRDLALPLSASQRLVDSLVKENLLEVHRRELSPTGEVTFRLTRLGFISSLLIPEVSRNRTRALRNWATNDPEARKNPNLAKALEDPSIMDFVVDIYILESKALKYWRELEKGGVKMPENEMLWASLFYGLASDRKWTLELMRKIYRKAPYGKQWLEEMKGEFDSFYKNVKRQERDKHST